MEKLPSIAIIGGTGNLGQALASRLARAGCKVIIGSRDHRKAERVADSLRKNLTGGSLEGKANPEAARETDLTIIAVPYPSHAEILRELRETLRTKTVIDAVVPLNRGKPFIPEAGSALLEARQILGPDVSLVGAFHHAAAPELLKPQAPLGDVLICGDNDDAKKMASEIIQKLGGRALDAGPAAHAYILEGLTGLLLYLNRKYKSNHAGVSITGIEKP